MNDGRAVSETVIAPDAILAVRLAAQDLQEHLKGMSGAELPIVVNPNGAIWDASTDVAIIQRATLPILWNPGTKAVVKRYDDRWTVEILIPMNDFGEVGPSQTYPWGIQVGRTRFTAGKPESWSIAPTGGPCATLNRWGNLWIRPW